jgi:N-acetylmuramoyl-L-alanine amidase
MRYIVAAPCRVRPLHFGGGFRLVRYAARIVGARCAINFGYFSMAATHPEGSYPVGQVTVDRTIHVWPDESCGHFHGVYYKDGALRFWHWLPEGVEWGLRAGPRLIEGGKVCDMSIADIAWELGGVLIGKKNARVAVGVRADGMVVLAYWDAVDMWQAARDMLALGCVEALAGDGGGSASWYCPETGDAIGERVVPNMLYVEGDAPAPTPRPHKALKLYLSPSQQPDNIGVGDYGDERAQMYRLAYVLAARLAQVDDVTVAVALPGMRMSEIVGESNYFGATVHVCLHSNASVKHDAIGCEVFYCPGSVVGKRLAERVYEKLCDENPHGGRRCAATGFYELKWTDAPAVYVEVGFHDNAEEAEWIRKSVTGIAKAIAAAISDEFMEV